MESSPSTEVSDGPLSPKRRRVGLLYDDRMCKHFDSSDHPENPNRILSIWNKLQASGINQRCVILNANEAEDRHIALVHGKKHIDLIKSISSPKYNLRRNRVANSYNSIYFNEGSSEAAYLATGSVVEVAEKVAKGDLDSGYAIVRPPGHHAEANEPMGFCLFNNVAVAASYLLNERKELGISKILIVDWDVHHGNATQKMFWKDPRVLFFSVHRHEFGNFYPCGDDGSYEMIGEGLGTGYNINVPWENHSCGDADYVAAWDHVLIPVAKAFDPDLIIVSAGFDAALNDPLGGCCVTPYGYSIMLSKLMELAQGKIVMALEGGYNLKSIANSSLACVETLLYDKPVVGSLRLDPFESTWRVIQAVRKQLSPFWPILSNQLPEDVTSKKRTLVASPDSDSETDDASDSISDDFAAAIEHVMQPLMDMKIEGSDGQATSPHPIWRSELSKVDVWYASFGSNMRESRLLCYIEGGQDEGMRKPSLGSVDKTRPKESKWRIFPHRLFFARDYTATWGSGGVAFLHPNSNSEDKAHMRLYKITLEQFNDVLRQETVPSFNMNCPLFDFDDLLTIEELKCIPVQAVKRGWYHNVLFLGKEDDIPILTMTCPLSDVDRFKSGELPMCAPSKSYANTLVKGLTEGMYLSEEDAVAYVEQASVGFTKGLKKQMTSKQALEAEPPTPVSPLSNQGSLPRASFKRPISTVSDEQSPDTRNVCQKTRANNNTISSSAPSPLMGIHSGEDVQQPPPSFLNDAVPALDFEHHLLRITSNPKAYRVYQTIIASIATLISLGEGKDKMLEEKQKLWDSERRQWLTERDTLTKRVHAAEEKVQAAEEKVQAAEERAHAAEERAHAAEDPTMQVLLLEAFKHKLLNSPEIVEFFQELLRMVMEIGCSELAEKFLKPQVSAFLSEDLAKQVDKLVKPELAATIDAKWDDAIKNDSLCFALLDIIKAKGEFFTAEGIRAIPLPEVAGASHGQDSPVTRVEEMIASTSNEG